jgi:hypothetical protein
MVLRVLVAFFLVTSTVWGQLVTQNPLDDLKNQVAKVLADANVPFTSEQQIQIALLIEEQRQPSEDLFGEIMDFQNGIPQGAERDRALAGIQWIHDAFRMRLPEYLTPEQRAAIEQFEARGGTLAAEIEGSGQGGAQVAQIQQIRVTNNPFNAENGTSGNRGPSGGQRTEVIERAGIGAFHGNFSAAFQDDALNARNPAARNKPQYHERTISGNISGPVLRDRLTSTFSFQDNRQENVGTVNALRLDGPFTLGITRPNVFREYSGEGILQLTDSNSLHFGTQYNSTNSRNNGIGNFTLPERGSDTSMRSFGFDVRQIWVVSDRTVYETSYLWRDDRTVTTPLTNGISINVLDAFNGGGSQNRAETDVTAMHLGNLLYHTGEKLTLRTGFNARYRNERNFLEDNFLGLFTFSDLESYRIGKPVQYEVNVGNPVIELMAIEAGGFLQTDFRLSNRFTLMAGTKYETQNNMSDYNDIDPRLGFAYAVGSSTVIRGGAGTFHTRFSPTEVRRLIQFDGTRQHTIRVSDPGWPDPYISGNVQMIPPRSRRIRADDFPSSYYATAMISIERSLPRNLFVTVSFDFNRGIHLLRLRNINAPLPGTITAENPNGIKPFPNEGDIQLLENNGFSSHKHLKLSMRQRFSIFNITANYTYTNGYSDGNNNSPPSNSYDLSQDWGRAGLEQAHVFNASVNSRLPLGAYLTTNITARSGSMYNITLGADVNKDGEFSDRPSGVPRNSATGPHYFTVGFNFSKAFQVTPSARPGAGAGTGVQASIFANLNNAFNMTNPGTPSGVMTSRNFGLSTSASAPREIEAGVRFQF